LFDVNLRLPAGGKYDSAELYEIVLGFSRCCPIVWYQRC